MENDFKKVLPQSVERRRICGEEFPTGDGGGAVPLHVLRNDAGCCLCLKAVSLLNIKISNAVRNSRNSYLSQRVVRRELLLHDAGSGWSGDHSRWHAKSQAAQQQTLLQLELRGWCDSFFWLGFLALHLLVLDGVEVNLANAVDDVL